MQVLQEMGSRNKTNTYKYIYILYVIPKIKKSVIMWSQDNLKFEQAYIYTVLYACNLKLNYTWR